MAKAEYRNAIRSKKMLKGAFAELLKERKDIFNITVTELIKRADVSRGTFYSHYSDIFSLAEELENEFLRELEKIFDQFTSVSISENPLKFFQTVSDFLKENEDFYRTMIQTNAPKNFMRDIKKAVMEEILQNEHFASYFKKREDFVVSVNFFCNGMMGLYEDYFSGSLKTTLDEIAVRMNAMLKVFFANPR